VKLILRSGGGGWRREIPAYKLTFYETWDGSFSIPGIDFSSYNTSKNTGLAVMQYPPYQTQ
jgi:hypothetical protein